MSALILAVEAYRSNFYDGDPHYQHSRDLTPFEKHRDYMDHFLVMEQL